MMDNGAILLVFSITILIVAISFAFILFKRRKTDVTLGPLVDALSDLKMVKDKLVQLDEIRTRLASSSTGQDDMRRVLDKTQEMLNHLKNENEIRKEREVYDSQMLKRLDSVIAGSYGKGRTGENMLHEVFKNFPKEMIITNFKVNNKVVEFGFRLASGKVLPIDSKWVASDLLLALDKVSDDKERESIIAAIDKELIKRVKEVTQYIDPAMTVPWAIAAVPDAVFAVCRKAHLEAHRQHIYIMSYSMAIPFTLSFYSLHLQYSRSLDTEELHACLSEFTRNLDEMERVLENKIAHSGVMLNNAYTEYKGLISRMKGSLAQLQVTADSSEKSGKEIKEVSSV